MKAGRGDFDLTMSDLRVVVRYVAETAEEILPVFEYDNPSDTRPRAAVHAAWAFANGATRSSLQRAAAADAHRASKDARTETSAFAARAAGDAAAAAYLHPIAKATQVGHILRAAVSAARIAELDAGGDLRAGIDAIERARDRATPDLIEILNRYPPVPTGPSRDAQLMAALDAALRER